MSETSRQFSLRHIRHETKLNNNLYSMLLDQNLVDVIISCDGTNIRAHQLILSANSSYFKSLFDLLESNRSQIPIIILKDVPLSDVKAIIEFMYRGEVSVEERQLSSVLKSAELLKVCGLTEVCLALRSQLMQSTAEDSGSTSGPVSNKRPRISDGITPSTQPNDLFSKLSNARFEIRPKQSTNRSPIQPLISTSPSKTNSIILSSSSTHPKTDSNAINTTKVNKTSMTRLSSSSKTCSNFIQIGRQHKDQPLIRSPNVDTISPKQTMRTSTWTPSQSRSSDQMKSSPERTQTRPSVVFIDDEPNEDFVEEIDIKPPIFELNERLRLEKEKNFDYHCSQRDSDIEITSEVRSKSRENSRHEYKPSLRSSVKSRCSSTSSQSSLSTLPSFPPPPPPPSYRIVQRSSSRLLRNIIKPTTCSTSNTSTNKSKESDDKSKSNPKKERITVRLIKGAVKSRTDPNSGGTDISAPEIECPSCGQVFNDQNKWNEHIAYAHLPFQT